MTPGPKLKTHCCHGHSYDDPGNTIIARSGKRAGRRLCRACARKRRTEFARSNPHREYYYDRHRRFARKAQRKVYFERVWWPKLKNWINDARLEALELSKEREAIESAYQRIILNRKLRRRENTHPIEDLYSVLSSIKSKVDKSVWFNLISSEPDPATALMAKEEYEEELKWKHTDRRVEQAEELDLDYIRICKLLQSSPNRNIISHLRKPPITKRSPERGLTQRHIKMSPGQYV